MVGYGIPKGIVARWNERGLDAEFRKLWRTQDSSFATLWDTEARPSGPRPYCVFQVGMPVPVAGMTSATGSAGKQNTLYNVEVQLNIYAFDKETAKGAAATVAVAMENYGFWDCSPEKIVTIKRAGDFSVREGDRQWTWVIRYTVQIDADEVNIGAN